MDNEEIIIATDELQSMRMRIDYYIFDQDYENAVFWSEKIYILTTTDKDLHKFLQCLIISKRFRNAIAIIENKYCDLRSSRIPLENSLDKAPLWIRYMAAKCYSNVGQCDKSIGLLYDIVPIVSVKDLRSSTTLDNSQPKSQLTNNDKPPTNKNDNDVTFVDQNLVIASAAKLKGTILEYMSDNSAVGYFVSSLTKDIFHYSSARKLFENKMITPKEVQCFINEYYNASDLPTHNEMNMPTLCKLSLAFYMLSSGLLSTLATKRKKSISDTNDNSYIDCDNNNQILWPEKLTIFTKYMIHKFNQSYDIMRWQAENYISLDYSLNSLNLTQDIINETNMDDHLACVLHALTLFRCCKTIDLKILADQLATDSNVSINKQIVYRIVCSIRELCIGNASQAQDNLRISVKLSAIAALRSTSWLISPAVLWIILGHAAWLGGDKEHALASFNSAADISPGLYITWFFIGGLHAETEESSLALTYYLKAHRIAVRHYTGVPLFMANEIACTLAKKGSYKMAIKILLDSLGTSAIDDKVLLDHIVRKQQTKMYITLLHNLCYCCFKSNLIQDAFRYAQLATSIDHGSIRTQKLLGVLLDHFGQHKNAQFLYQTIVLESSKIYEFKQVSSNQSMGLYHPNNALPPEINASFQAKDHDTFCTYMIERSLELEKKESKFNINSITNMSMSLVHDKGKNPSTSSIHNTSLSFDIDKTAD